MVSRKETCHAATCWLKCLYGSMGGITKQAHATQAAEAITSSRCDTHKAHNTHAAGGTHSKVFAACTQGLPAPCSCRPTALHAQRGSIASRYCSNTSSTSCNVCRWRRPPAKQNSRLHHYTPPLLKDNMAPQWSIIRPHTTRRHTDTNGRQRGACADMRGGERGRMETPIERGPDM